MSKNIAVFPGTFDPITKGHVDIVLRGAHLFDKVIVAIGLNTKKETLFSLEQRLEWLNLTFENHPKIEIKY